MFFLKKSRIAIVALGIATAGAASAQTYINDLNDFYLGGFEGGISYGGSHYTPPNVGWLPSTVDFGNVDTSGIIGQGLTSETIDSFDFTDAGTISQTVNVSSGGDYALLYLVGIAQYQSVVDPLNTDLVSFTYTNTSNQVVNLTESTDPAAYQAFTSNGPSSNGAEYNNLLEATLSDVAANSAITITVDSSSLVGQQAGSDAIGNVYFSAPPTTVIGPGTTPEPFTMALGIAGAGLAVKRARKKKQIA